MLIEIDDLLSVEVVARMRAALDTADWQDGRSTAGYQSALAKHNRQLAEDDQLAVALGAEVAAALATSLAFQAAAIPARVFPPLFNRYADGDAFGAHIDGRIGHCPTAGRCAPTCR